jgi:hypothetical protein
MPSYAAFRCFDRNSGRPPVCVASVYNTSSRVGEEGLGEPHEVGFAELHHIAHLELKNGLLRRKLERSSGGHRPFWRRLNLQLSAVQQDRIAQNANLSINGLPSLPAIALSRCTNM